MRRFLYFLPGLPGANAGMLAERGLLNRFTSSGSSLLEHCITACPEGPAGGGCIVALGQRPAAYEPGSQRWIEGEKCWVGIEDAPPRPDDLVREVIISGAPMQLGDGEFWTAPIIRRWNGAWFVPNVPQAMGKVTKDGRTGVEFRIRPEYAGVDEIAGRMFELFLAGSAVSIDQLLQDASELLAVNYRIGPEEASLLGLFDEKNAVAVISQSFDRATIEREAAERSIAGLEYSEPMIEVE